MTIEQFQPYFLPALILGFLAWRFIRFRKVKAQLPNLMGKGAIVVDVRTPAEFASGSRPGSLNIPLDRLESGIKKLDRSKPIVLCCASGSRSAMAVGILKRHGFENVINAGPWTNTLTDVSAN